MDWISNSAGRILESVESNPFPFLGPLQGLWAPTRSLLPTRLHVDISSQHWFEKSHTTSWRRQWQPTPVFLPGKSNGQRSLVGCSPWGCEESDTTEWLHFHFSLSCIGEGNGNPLQCSCLENPRDGGAWWAAVYGVAQSWTRLKWLSSSSSSSILLVARSVSVRVTLQIVVIFMCSWGRWIQHPPVILSWSKVYMIYSGLLIRVHWFIC